MKRFAQVFASKATVTDAATAGAGAGVAAMNWQSQIETYLDLAQSLIGLLIGLGTLILIIYRVKISRRDLSETREREMGHKRRESDLGS